jgi:hypothetical protein
MILQKTCALRGGTLPLLLITALAVYCRAASAHEVLGHPQQGAAPIQETTAQIMARDLGQSGQTRLPHLAPRYGLSSENAVAASVSSSSGALPPSPSTLKAQTVSPTINFTAANFNDCSGWPPDTMGTVGPTQFIIALNGRIRSFSKATGLADGGINVDTDTFFSPVMTPGSNFTTDPRIRYDRLSGRWFIIMIDVPGQQGTLPNRVMIAMSNSGTITGSTVWSFFQFSGDPTNFADYPTLGIDANALYIGANIFSTSNGSLVNTTAFVVRKSSLLGGGPIVVTSFTGLIATSGHPPRAAGPFTPQGVDNYDPASTEGYFIGVDISSTSTLQLRRVSNPAGTPSLSGNVSISVSGFAVPINVTVQGTSGTIDALGSPARLLAAHYRNGSLWTSHNVGVNSSGGTSSPDRNGVRWYEIQGIPTGQTPSVAQSGTIFQSGAAALSYWMGTIMVSGQGHAAAGFTQAGPNNFLDAATTGRLASDPPGAMDTPVSYTSSSSAYNPSDASNPHRWGDYSYTSLDPADDMTMWTVQEWCQSAGNGFAVQVAKLLAPPPALPTGCSPSTVTQGMSGVTVTITGSSSNGFFDPGPGFPNHLGVTVNGGGITVASVTYNNPSNLTAVLNVASNANPSARTITVTNPDGQTATNASGLVTVVTSSGNQPPSLAPISNQTVAVGMTLTYTNVASDPDGDQLAFSLGAGAAANASINPTTGVFTWAPVQAQIGTNQFSVIVTDNGTPSLSATQSFHVVVVQSNSPPTLAPISDKEVAVGMTLTVTNTASDSDGDQLTFSLGPGAPANATIDASTGLFTWAPTQAQIGNHPLSMIVTDNGFPSLSATQSFYVLVVQSNSPPTLAPISNQELALSMTLVFTNSASDPDGDQLTFSLGPGAATNATLNATNGVFTWTPTSDQLGSNNFSVLVADNGFPSLSATQSFDVFVVPSNSPPTLAPIADQEVAVGMTLLITNSASDPDSDQLTFSLGSGAPVNATINASSGLFTWAPTQAQIGNHAFSVIVTDNGFPSLSATQSFSVLVVQSNSPPTLAPISNQELALGMPLVFTNSASDPNGDQLTFSLGPGAAINATLNATNGVFTWTPTSAQLGSNNFSVIVTDNGFPSLSATQSFDVFVVPSNSPPTLAPIAGQEVAIGMTLTVTNVATDADGDQLTFSLGAGAPDNAGIDPSTGLLTWAPTQAQIGNHAFGVIVTDNGFPSLSATQSFSVLVVQSNSPPTLAPISNQELALGMTLVFTNSASDPDGDQLTFSLGSGVATNATLNTTNGVFTWMPTPDQLGSNNFSIIVTDNGFPSLSATQRFDVFVVPSNSPPTLAPIADQEVPVGMTLTVTNAASDPDGDQLTFSLGAGAPANATINPSSGLFTWAPTQAQIGNHPFSVIVTDNGFPSLSATQSFSVLVVQSNSPPSLAPIPNQELALGMTLLFTNSANDPDGDELTFSLGSGVATNATINATNGVFTWMPTPDQLGSNNFSIIVTDNGLPSLSATQTFDVFVVPSNSPPTLAPIADRELAVGMTLFITNSATDADGDQLTFSLGPGTPANATIDPTTGLLSWAPTEAQLGSNSFGVIVTDNGFPPLSATQTFAVLVVQSNSPPTLTPIPDQAVYASSTLRFTNSATDPDAGQVLTFSLDPGAPAGAGVDPASGIFTWTPTQAQIGSSAVIVRVTDNGLPNLSDSKSFVVTILAGPVLRVGNVSSNGVTLVWDAISGNTYRVLYTTDLANPVWVSLTPDVVATNSTATFTGTNPQPVTFYRLLVVR